MHVELDLDGFEDMGHRMANPQASSCPTLCPIDKASNEILAIRRNYAAGRDPTRAKLYSILYITSSCLVLGSTASV
jgi:hypothetical protein